MLKHPRCCSQFGLFGIGDWTWDAHPDTPIHARALACSFLPGLIWPSHVSGLAPKPSYPVGRFARRPSLVRPLRISRSSHDNVLRPRVLLSSPLERRSLFEAGPRPFCTGLLLLLITRPATRGHRDRQGTRPSREHSLPRCWREAAIQGPNLRYASLFSFVCFGLFGNRTRLLWPVPNLLVSVHPPQPFGRRSVGEKPRCDVRARARTYAPVSRPQYPYAYPHTSPFMRAFRQLWTSTRPY